VLEAKTVLGGHTGASRAHYDKQFSFTKSRSTYCTVRTNVSISSSDALDRWIDPSAVMAAQSTSLAAIAFRVGLPSFAL